MGERLRARSGKKLSYNEDVNEAEWEVEEREHIEAKQVPAKKKRLRAESCAVCSEKDDLIFCPGCQEAYHLGCLVPPLKVAPRGKWSCPQCVDPLSDIEKFLDCQKRLPDVLNNDGDSDSPSPSLRPSNHYLVKWKSKSHLHCSWISENDLERAGKSLPGLKMKLNNFRRQMDSLKGSNIEDEWIPIRSEWTTVDRILAHRDTGDITEYLVKWKELGYEEATWEVESDMTTFQEQIDKYNSINTRGSGSTSKKRKGFTLENNDAKSRRKDFKAYDGTPKFLSSGCVLHPYQLEGLNFLRFAWRQGKHVILADEMGLGKTIQSISFLASLKVEGVSLPHLVVAPLSTLRNWEREFAIWAPHLNTVMYVGPGAARAVIKEYEFYYPKEKIKSRKKKLKKRKAPVHQSKQDRIKFDILLTSYEMINLDTASLKAIKWECLVVDEGHRLKNKDSKLFQTLKQYSTKHRVLLTGTPLQNNMDELFMLMHFLDAGKFSSLEDFQQEFNDINQEEQISRLHKMLAPHLLRRVKKDVLKDMPPKKELILRVELSPLQKEYYRAILTKNYEVLSRRGGAQISLNNVVMELRKLCGHPYMLEGVEPVVRKVSEAYRQLVEASGKLMLLDKMMEKLKANGHRVLIYSQFKRLLDILEDWLIYKNWTFERIDGNISGAERQIRIDRFNAKDSNRFCFLLSTRAGGLGINLATADTVIIYDSDWNPHADLQAMARAHRLGQTKKVMIFRLVTRSSIEERMMQLSKKKMVLEHLVVGRLKTQQVLNQEELDDILRYGAKDLFAEENDETKSQQIRYDDAAIDRLLDRSQVENEDASVDDDDRDILKAFKVANFEYVDEEEVAPAQSDVRTGESSEASLDPNAKANYWDELLKDRYEEQKYEMITELGKGKRTRKQVMPLAEDDLAGMAGISSDEEDDESLPPETNSSMKETNEPATKKPQSSKKKIRESEPSGPPPLLEGEGKSLKVLGFNRRQRATFVQVLMRFGLGDFSWSEFFPRLKPKTLEEIKEYGTLFLTHIAEEITNTEFFSDGVPKEGLSVQDVLVRLAILHLIQDKVKCSLEEPSAPLFSEDVHNMVSAIKHPKFWNETHDRRLLQALLKHGYGRWQEIADDASLGFDSVVCKELQLPPVSSIPIPDATSSHANAISQENIPPRETVEGNPKQEVSPQASDGISHPGSSGSMRDAQLHKKIAEFVKKRALILERALNAEYHRETSVDQKEEEENIEENIPVEELGVENDIASLALYADEIARIAFDNDPQRFYIAQMFNEMCKMLLERETDAAETYGGNKSAGIRVRKFSREIDSLCAELWRTILPFVKDVRGGVSINGGGGVGGSSGVGMNRHMEDCEDLEADLDSEAEDLNTPSQHCSGKPQNGAGKQNHPIREPGGGSTSIHGPFKHLPKENTNSFSVEKHSSAFFQASQQSATKAWPPVVILDD